MWSSLTIVAVIGLVVFACIGLAMLPRRIADTLKHFAEQDAREAEFLDKHRIL